MGEGGAWEKSGVKKWLQLSTEMQESVKLQRNTAYQNFCKRIDLAQTMWKYFQYISLATFWYPLYVTKTNLKPPAKVGIVAHACKAHLGVEAGGLLQVRSLDSSTL